jgi:hypothetical protein
MASQRPLMLAVLFRHFSWPPANQLQERATPSMLLREECQNMPIQHPALSHLHTITLWCQIAYVGGNHRPNRDNNVGVLNGALFIATLPRTRFIKMPAAS